MENKMAVITDLKQRCAQATALEEEGRWDEADAVWAEMEKIAAANEPSMERSAAPIGELAGRAGNWIANKGWPALRKLVSPIGKFFNPTERFRGKVAPALEGLMPQNAEMKLQRLMRERNALPFLQRLLHGGETQAGEKVPSLLSTHGPLAGAIGAGALGLYGAGRRSGHADAKHDTMGTGMGGSYIPTPYEGGSYRSYQEPRGGYDQMPGYGPGMPGGGPGGAGAGAAAAIPAVRAQMSELDERVRALENRVGQLEGAVRSR